MSIVLNYIGPSGAALFVSYAFTCMCADKHRGSDRRGRGTDGGGGGDGDGGGGGGGDDGGGGTDLFNTHRLRVPSTPS